MASMMAIGRGRLPDDLAEALLELRDPRVALQLDRDDRVSPAMRKRLANHPDAAVREAGRRTARDSLEIHSCRWTCSNSSQIKRGRPRGRGLPPILIRMYGGQWPDPGSMHRSMSADRC
jgi:hypothetical protein